MSSLEQTAKVTGSFERERCPFHAAQLEDALKPESQRRREAMQVEERRKAQRNSYMVKRQQPKPVLRPGPTLSKGADREAFDSQLRADETRAQRENLKALYRTRDKLIQDRKSLSAQAQNLQAAKSLHRAGSTKEAQRELYKIQRSTNDISRRCQKHFAQAVQHTKAR